MGTTRPENGCPRLATKGRLDLALMITSFTLCIAGVTVIAVGASNRFLPHDERYLGMTAVDLCSLHGCRVVHFMVHDRVAFGGAAAAAGVLYLWLVASPLRRGEPWAWRALVHSGAIGFASFLAYLGYGYLDTWHGLVTAGLFAAFAFGILRTRPHGASPNRDPDTPIAPLRWPHTISELGRLLLLAAAAGLTVGGFTIMLIGMTCVFVPQDLAFMGINVAELHSLNPRLVSLIAHDRAAFGGAVCACGVALWPLVRRGDRSRATRAVLGVAGFVGFGPAILIHVAVGYDDLFHLAPAILGAATYSLGLVALGIGEPRPFAKSLRVEEYE